MSLAPSLVSHDWLMGLGLECGVWTALKGALNKECHDIVDGLQESGAPK